MEPKFPLVEKDYTVLNEKFGMEKIEQYVSPNAEKDRDYFFTIKSFTCHFKANNISKSKKECIEETCYFRCYKCKSSIIERKYSENSSLKYLVKIKNYSCWRRTYVSQNTIYNKNHQNHRIKTGSNNLFLLPPPPPPPPPQNESLKGTPKVEMLRFFPDVIDLKGVCVQVYLKVHHLMHLSQFYPKEIVFTDCNNNSQKIQEFKLVEFGEGIGDDHVILNSNLRILFIIPISFSLSGSLHCCIPYGFRNNIYLNGQCLKYNALQVSSDKEGSKKRKLNEYSVKDKSFRTIVECEGIYGVKESLGPISGGENCFIFIALNINQRNLNDIDENSFLVSFGLQTCEVLTLMSSRKMKNTNYVKDFRDFKKTNLVLLVVTPKYFDTGPVDVLVEYKISSKKLFLKGGYTYMRKSKEKDDFENEDDDENMLFGLDFGDVKFTDDDQFTNINNNKSNLTDY